MRELHPFYRDTWAEVNLNAISENVKNIKQSLPEDVAFMAVVKANAYGHGAVDIAKEALASGATYLGVAILDEAIALRKAGIEAPLLVLGYVRPEDVRMAVELNLTLTVFQSDWIERAAPHLLVEENERVKCHVKMDSGMGRIGIRSEEERRQLVKALLRTDQFEVEGLYTHLATADEIHMEYFEKQQARFMKMIKEFEEDYGHSIPIKHCGNSAAALRFADRCYNLVRVGIAMYGLCPSEEIKGMVQVPLKEAFSLHSRITHVKKLPKGEGISYGVTYQTQKEEWIATIPIGYADGWIRANQSGDVLVQGRRAKIVGRICMDQMMISLDTPVSEGTKVTIIGRDEDDYISVDEVARRLDTINYEIPCVISYRVPRAMIKNNEILHVHNEIF
ncbi:alanine racemase [Salipaludibacillus keqinensis]|uniref:Alanine racemase n=1 Tax=Salipaludibacillus keqinensis TaxID=2045207 RepID=A0A323TRV7_9BACI|nr:alanine racemase [Salipaludibacillus keqinensis]PYZ92115.1 alanine racemase [Salipaludibacillus keqinensis]